jgi:hypothetical protein
MKHFLNEVILVTRQDTVNDFVQEFGKKFGGKVEAEASIINAVDWIHQRHG